MMWLVRIGLRRPYTFVVLALLILILGAFSIRQMPVDIFPNIDIPVISVGWGYNGLSAQEMSNRFAFITERTLTSTVNDVEHIESQSLNGSSNIKVYFYPQVNISTALSQVTAICQAITRFLPAGTNPPFVLEYSASTVPVLQLGLSGQGLTEQDLADLSQNAIRPQLATVEGAQVTYFGGRNRTIMVDLDSAALQARGLSPADVTTAMGTQNIVLPAGTAKIGKIEYSIETNSAPSVIAELNDLPIRTVNGAVVYIRDVAHVHDGSTPQTNLVRVDGNRSALLSINKIGSTSTLNIISGVRDKIALIKGQLPARLEIKPLADQSIFVRSAVNGVLREAIAAACLTAIMILVFLGSWRSTIIIAVSIPLSILSSFIILWLLGETINIMTLGGMALAVGILVDDATVAIENINRFLESGSELERSILDGSAQIAVPAFVSTLAICIVFVPMFLLSGVARYLFVPMAEAVVFAMMSSYVLSRTLVPTMAKYLLLERDDAEMARRRVSRNPFSRFQIVAESSFESLRSGYIRLLAFCVDHSGAFVIVFLLMAAGSVAVLTPWLGQDFFPAVDAGQFKIHVRAHTGTRIEETAALCDHIDATIRSKIPSSEVAAIIDNIGIPGGINLFYSTSAPVGPADADIQVQLTENHHPTAEYVDALRKTLTDQYPGVTFYVLPADVVSQILNFGLSAPIDVQVLGSDLYGNRALAERVLSEVRRVPGAADARIQQPFNQPNFTVDVDRTRAKEVGFTQADAAQSLLISLSGSFQTSPSFYLDPKTGVTYSVAVMSPQYGIDSLAAIKGLPMSIPAARTATAAGTATGPAGSAPSPSSITNSSTSAPGAQQPIQVLGSLATLTPGAELGTVSHYDMQNAIDIYANVAGSDLGSVTRSIQKIVDEHKKELPRGSSFILRGQSQTMRESYFGLLTGLAFSILLVYLLIVVNFQSWLDPFLIISALPAALAGIVWILFLTNTRLSVPALTGAIMCMGVATANSILVVSFAREQLSELVGDARRAALNAGYVRLRPVLMTALAMIIGMVPMALGLGEGGEQNAPLGRAVIGGLLLATVATLFFVPSFFSLVHGYLSRRHVSKGLAGAHGNIDDEFTGDAS